MPPVDLTVAALVERNGLFLFVEETVAGRRVLTQPGGHIEAGESPEEAARREVLEEAACDVSIRDLIGAYMWSDRDRQFLRIVFVADLLAEHPPAVADASIHAIHWLSYGELVESGRELRSHSVIRSIDDYLSGERQPRSLFAGCHRRDEQLDTALASAALLSA